MEGCALLRAIGNKREDNVGIIGVLICIYVVLDVVGNYDIT